MLCPGADRSLRRYLLALSEESRFQFFSSKSASSDLHAIDSFMTWSWELSSPCDSPSKFWCKHMPPNSGIKVILFQNYHVCIPDRSVVTGRESWSGVYCLSLSIPAHELMLQTFTIASLLHGHLGSCFQAGYKMSIQPWWEQLNNSAMSFFYLSSRVPPTPLDPPWSILLLWRSWAVRRILVHGAIVLLILAHCRARGSAIAVRGILMISPESSLHVSKVVLVFARAKMCGHLPLVCSSKRPPGKPQASFP